MKKRKIIWIIVIALVIFGVWFFGFRKKKVEIVLTTEKPAMGNIASTITATGTVQPVDTVAVGTQVSGTISKVYVDFNSIVHKGQLLAELDKTLLMAQVQQVNAAIQQSQSQLNYQRSNVNRQQQLYNAGAISKAELETAQNEFKIAQANINSSSAQLQAAQKNFSLANIYSPIDGTVLSRNVSEGQTVAASFNTPTLFSIAKDLAHMQVRASVDEADIGSVQKGQRVEFTVDAFPNDVFDGTLLEIRLQPTVAANVVTYTTIIDAPNTSLKLKPGMTATVTVFTREEKNVLLVSAKATRFKPDSSLMTKYTIVRAGQKRRNTEGSTSASDSFGSKTSAVWILNGTTITQRFIKTGLEDGTQVQVISGLAPGDEVVNGVQAGKVQTNSEAKSPFMPQRRSNQRPAGSGGDNRPSR